MMGKRMAHSQKGREREEKAKVKKDGKRQLDEGTGTGGELGHFM
jgi:hypothetical protein